MTDHPKKPRPRSPVAARPQSLPRKRGEGADESLEKLADRVNGTKGRGGRLDWHLVRLVCGDDYIHVFVAIAADGRPAPSTIMLFKGTWDGDEFLGEFRAEPDDHFFAWFGDAVTPTSFGAEPIRLGQVVHLNDGGDRYEYRIERLEKLNA